jgi:hypothetical protein
MRTFAAVVVALVFVAAAAGGDGRVVRGDGVALTVPAGWGQVEPASPGPVTDPRTLLVVGTHGVEPVRTKCQIGTYRVPTGGAVVVIVGWKGANGDGGPGLESLARLTSVQPSIFECFHGRGAVSTLVVRQREYQVNVMVGGSASKRRVAEALAVGRTFRVF